jgi:Mn-dependent DtxR family transcriptional regulator
MLGVQRTTVTGTAKALQDAGLIRYQRGHIQLRDVEGVKNVSCECYATLAAHAERLLGVKRSDARKPVADEIWSR